MRARSVATVLVALTAGAAASAAFRRLGRRRRPATAAVPASAAPAAAPAVEAVPVAPAVQQDAVVLDFARRSAAVAPAARPAPPARCGDNGGRTKAGTPCGARAASGGRCHHHRLAA